MNWTPPRFDLHQFAGKHARAISRASEISYSDFARMHVHRRKKQQERRLVTPEWAATNDGILETALKLCERRYFQSGRGGLRANNSGLTFQQRIARIREKEIGVEKDYCARLVALIKRYSQEMKDGAPPAQLEKVHTQIQNMDRQVLACRRGALALTVSIAYLYHRNGWSSAEVAEHLGKLTPTGVRQTLARLNMAYSEKVYCYPKYAQWKIKKAEHRAE